MDHAAHAQLIAGRALGDLDADEWSASEAHLQACQECRSLARDLDAVLGGLAVAAPPRQVPAALGAHVMAALHAPAAGWQGPPAREASRPTARQDGVAPRDHGRAGLQALHRPSLRRPAFLRPPALGWLSLGAAAAGVLALAVLGVQVLDLRGQLGEAQRMAAEAARVAGAATAELATRETAMAVVANPAHASAWLEPSATNVTGTALMVYLPGSAQAYLLAQGLPATADGRVYQFWYADPAGVHPGTTFSYDGGGVLLIPVTVDLGSAQAAMLTLEPAGGSTGEPGPDIVFGELPAI